MSEVEIEELIETIIGGMIICTFMFILMSI